MAYAHTQRDNGTRAHADADAHARARARERERESESVSSVRIYDHSVADVDTPATREVHLARALARE